MNTHSIPRRTFLRSATLAALAPLAATAFAKPGDDSIDAHVHVWTPDTDRYPLSSKFKKTDMQPPSFTPEELFAHCKPEKVNRVVLIQMSFYQFDNRYMTDMIAKHRDVFRGVGIVDETKADVTDTMKALAGQGVRGFRLYTDKE
jgi:predicted TIM-barrel fold metal-dependent hydrolase